MEPAGVTRGLADDLRFAQRLLSLGGHVRRLDHVLVVYRHHKGQLSHVTPRKLLVRLRARALESRVLCHWPRFDVWGAGRDARAFVASLQPRTRAKISQIVDVDPLKIGRQFVSDEMSVPIVHFSSVKPPVVVCVARNRTNGELERNVASQGLVEGEDCWSIV
jgi:hypothetical protein